jgi:hypothetical protein
MSARELILEMEEPLRDAEELIRAALMAASGISDRNQREAMICILYRAVDEADKVVKLWKAADKSDTGKAVPPKKRSVVSLVQPT